MKYTSGFVLIELIVVFGMLAVITIMTVTNVFGSSRTASLSGTVNGLIADVKSQQTKAMSGTQISGALPLGYGVHFDATGYTLFRGLTYSAADTTNSRVPNDPRVTFSSISLPSNSIVFASRSGEFIGYASSSSSLTIRHADSGNSKTIQFNKYGVITSIN